MEKKQRNVDLQGFSVDDFLSPTNTTNKVDQPIFDAALHKSSPSIVMTSATEQSVQTEQPKRTSSKQRKESLEEYRETFLHAPKIIDRQPVFISRDFRDKIDEIVRKLGERKMSVSGFIENLARYHLEVYKEEFERWKRL